MNSENDPSHWSEGDSPARSPIDGDCASITDGGFSSHFQGSEPRISVSSMPASHVKTT
jgi:hypothetical protein